MQSWHIHTASGICFGDSFEEYKEMCILSEKRKLPNHIINVFFRKDEKADKFMYIETGLGINASYY